MAFVSLRDMSVSFGATPALRGVSLSLGRGDALGLVGESGCGKSVTWLAALGLLPGTAQVTGEVLIDGSDALTMPVGQLEKIRGGRIAMIFQDPASSLNPVHRIGRQIVEALTLHRGIAGAEARAEAKRLLDQVGIPDAARRLDGYPHELSGGQNQRVMIAMALAGQPEMLVADEPTTALDVTIQAQILDLLRALRRDTGMALVLISHDLGVVAETCDRIAVMYAGRIVEEAPSETLFRNPQHPYTRGLMGALPPISGERQRLVSIRGSVPDPNDMPAGCAFAPRCADRFAACDTSDPANTPVGHGHRAACLGVREWQGALRADGVRQTDGVRRTVGAFA